MPDKWHLVTDEVDGRREILGWTRKGKTVKYKDGPALEEWLVLCLEKRSQARTITISCDRYGWLPESEEDFLLRGAPICDTVTRNLVVWQERVTQEILEAAERYRANNVGLN